MRGFGKFLMGISLVISFLVLLVSISARFQLLDASFWITSFRDASAYEKLDDLLITETEKTFIEEGANQKEAEMISALFESNSLQIFVERNITNIFDYINQKTDTLNIYLPLARIPKDIKADLQLTSDEISINKLMSTFGRDSTPFGQEIFIQMRTLGNYTTIALIVAVISIIVNLFLLYRLEAPGRRMVATSISIIVCGVLGLILAILINVQITNISKDLIRPNKETVQVVLGTLAPSSIEKIVKLWAVISGITIGLGALTLFIKKPGASP